MIGFQQWLLPNRSRLAVCFSQTKPLHLEMLLGLLLRALKYRGARQMVFINRQELPHRVAQARLRLEK
jgi:hypothetical protein